jgi:DNA-binding HxlR family transcriptional regulator
MKELEARGMVERRVLEAAPVRVQYAVTEMGRALGPTFAELQGWAQRWLR